MFWCLDVFGVFVKRSALGAASSFEQQKSNIRMLSSIWCLWHLVNSSGAFVGKKQKSAEGRDFDLYLYLSWICDTCKHLLGIINPARCRTRINSQKAFRFFSQLYSLSQFSEQFKTKLHFRKLCFNLWKFETRYSTLCISLSGQRMDAVIREQSHSLGISEPKPRKSRHPVSSLWHFATLKVSHTMSV